MRIDAYNQISQVYKANNKTKVSKAASVKSTSYDVDNEAFANKLLEKFGE